MTDSLSARPRCGLCGKTKNLAVFPMKELSKGANFEKLFRLRLSFALLDAPSLAPWKDAPLIYVAGNPRMVIGAMNDMRKQLAWRTETPAFGPMEDDEDWINKTPFLSLPTNFPDKEFSQRLMDKQPKA